MNNKDKIIIKDLEIYAHHGVFKEENTLGQKFVITIELEMDLRKAGREDSLEDSVHYGELSAKVTEMFKRENYKLIETCCEKTAEFILLNYGLVQGVRILLKKPWAPVGLPLEYPAVEIYRKKHKAYIGVGSNMGDRMENINEARRLMGEKEHTKILREASIIETEPFGGVEQDNFLNTVFEIETLLEPLELLDFTMGIEKQLKRERNIRWGPRTMDLDILLYDDIITEDERVIIPHLGISEREFVLKSLCELVPYKVHPLLNKRLFQLKNDLK